MNRSNKKAYNFGLLAEFAVRCFLRLKLYNIIEKRYRCKFGEIDIIAQKGRTIIFVEVKARKDGQYEVLTNYQKGRINRSASWFLSKNSRFNRYNARFDMMLVSKYLLPKHVKNAWFL